MEEKNEIQSGMWHSEFDENGDLAGVKWSQSYRTMLGFTDETDFPDEIESWITRIHPDDMESVFGALRSALRGADRFEMKYRLLTKKNGYCWIRDKGEVTRREDGTLSSYMGYITFAKQAVESAWEKRDDKMFSSMLVKAQTEVEKQTDIMRALCSDYIAVYRVDMRGDKFETLLVTGELREEIPEMLYTNHVYTDAIEAYISNFVRDDDADYVRRRSKKEHVLKELKKKPKFYIRYRVKDNPAQVETFEMHFARTSDTEDRDIVILAFRNIDELLKEREEERMATQRDIEETLEGARTGLWALEQEGEITRLHSDRTMKYLLGVELSATPEECYEVWKNGVEDGYLDQAVEAINQMRESGRAEVIYPWNHPKLGQIYVRCGGVRDDKYTGSGYRVKGYHQDITETMVIRKKQEKVLMQALQEANQANKAKTEFLSHMSHDIRTPINGILGSLYICEKNPGNEERQKDCRDKIRQSAEHLLSLVNDVLDITKLESGNVTMAETSFDIRDIITSCNSMIQNQAERLGLEYQADCHKVIHERVIGSPLHLRQILVNIAGNAVKYTHAGGKITVTVEESAFTAEEAEYKFTISDTGIGMTEEFQEHLFEPFTQEAADVRTYYRGTGLGMAITKKLVDQMNGSISVKSKKGEGSTFCVILPFRIDRKKEETEKAEENGSKTPPDISGMKILLVEDNEINSEIVQFILEEAHAVVDTATNGVEAVDRFAQSRPGEYGCILMDIMMPVMDGLEATRQIRTMNRADSETVPIFALSANAFTEDVFKAKHAGMNGHLAKPLNIQSLLEAIASVSHV